MKENNGIYLEDELGDILWNYLNLVECLKNEGKIISLRNIISRTENKYEIRINSIKGDKTEKERTQLWKETKQKQKEELKKEHNEKYSNIK